MPRHTQAQRLNRTASYFTFLTILLLQLHTLNESHNFNLTWTMDVVRAAHNK